LAAESVNCESEATCNGDGGRRGQSSLFLPTQTRKKCRTDPAARRHDYRLLHFRSWHSLRPTL